MSDPLLTEEQVMVQEMVREFAERELASTAEETDRSGALPADRAGQLAELGLFGVGLPEEVGGLGGQLAAALAIEELARACSASAFLLVQRTSLAAHALSGVAGDLVEPLVEGSAHAALALLDGTIGDAVDGSSRHVTGAAGARWLVVLSGDTLAVVDGSADVETTGTVDRLGLRGVDTTHLTFAGTPHTQRHTVDGERLLSVGRLGLAALAVGVAQAAVDRATRHSHEREQFGTPIARFGAVRTLIAESEIEVRAARAYVHECARRLDAGQDARVDIAAAKRFATAAATRAGDRAIQVHGGYGFCRDYHVERQYRDAQQLELELGGGDIHRQMVAGALLA